MEIDFGKIAQQITEFCTVYGLKVLAALVILVVGMIIAKIIRKLVRRVLEGRKVDSAIVSFTTGLVYSSLVVFVVIAALGQLGVRTTSLVAVIGAAGLAIGLALQGSLSNFAAGFLILVFKPFKASDFIEANGVAGVVKSVHIFTTELRTPDNKVIIVPNAKLTDDNIINYSAAGERRIDMVVGIAYDADIDQARQIMADILSSDDRVLEDPAPQIAVSELADNSVNFVLRPWVKVEHYWDAMFEITEKVKKAFDKAGIGIPFPQRDVWLHQIDDDSAA